jgi:hypothetical protein
VISTSSVSRWGLTESYWNGRSSRDELISLGAQLRQRHWQHQQKLDCAPMGDFFFHDQVLDMSFTLGNLPKRVRDVHGPLWTTLFAWRAADRPTVRTNTAVAAVTWPPAR